MKKYYIIKFTIKHTKYYTMWYTNNKSGFLVKSGKLRNFPNKNHAINFAEKKESKK